MGGPWGRALIDETDNYRSAGMGRTSKRQSDCSSAGLSRASLRLGVVVHSRTVRRVPGRVTGGRDSPVVKPSRSTPRVAIGTTLTSSLFASAAFAVPNFHSSSSSVNNSGALVVSFDERGLGNANVNYTLTAVGAAVYACINGGGNHPKAANKETVNAEVSANASFAVKNGRVVASMPPAGPPSAGSFSCPGGQKLRLASVSYANIVLTDTTNGVSTQPPNVSRVFFAV